MTPAVCPKEPRPGFKSWTRGVRIRPLRLLLHRAPPGIRNEKNPTTYPSSTQAGQNPQPFSISMGVRQRGQRSGAATTRRGPVTPVPLEGGSPGNGRPASRHDRQTERSGPGLSPRKVDFMTGLSQSLNAHTGRFFGMVQTSFKGKGLGKPARTFPGKRKTLQAVPGWFRPGKQPAPRVHDLTLPGPAPLGNFFSENF